MRSGEMALIDAFLRPFGLARDGARGRGVLAGPGDDCAVVQPSRGMKPEVALVVAHASRAAAWSLALCALGEAARPRGRRGARPGDALVVVGQIGAAALGLRRKGAAGLAQRRPTPLVREGLAASGLPTA